MSLALHAEKNAKANYKILALEQSSGALTTSSEAKLYYEILAQDS